MSANFDRAFIELLDRERGYVNNPDDPGGETNWGITKNVARECGYMGAMKDMDQSVAKAIYAKLYWIPPFDELPYPVAFVVFDGAVNSGVEQSVRWLQRAVNCADDGRLGPITLAAAKEADPLITCVLALAERGVFMTNLSTWPKFGKGWARRIFKNLKLAARQSTGLAA